MRRSAGWDEGGGRAWVERDAGGGRVRRGWGGSSRAKSMAQNWAYIATLLYTGPYESIRIHTSAKSQNRLQRYNLVAVWKSGHHLRPIYVVVCLLGPTPVASEDSGGRKPQTNTKDT